MKKNVILINTARGDLINENDLLSFLQKNKEALAALDVFAEEPYYGPLANLPNTLLTPHIASFAKETRLKMEQETIKNLILGLQ